MACNPHRPAAEILADWEPITVEFTEFMFGKRTVPGWKCKHCGALYGCVEPPSRCWKCPKAQVSARKKPSFRKAKFCRGDGKCSDCLIITFKFCRDDSLFKVCLSSEGCSLKSEVPVKVTEKETA
jgi:hypothetical protein